MLLQELAIHVGDPLLRLGAWRVPNPLSEGWLILLVIAFIPTLIGVAKSVAAKWRLPLAELEQENQLLKKEAVERTEVLTDFKVRRMFLEARLEYCEAELKNWRSGKWRSGNMESSQ